jgi:hypothetical protein
VLTVLPPPQVRDEEALMRVAAWFVWPGWERALLWECAAFHLIAATVLAILGQPWWAAAFLVGAVAPLALLRRASTTVQLIAWYTVFPLGFTWGGPLALGLIDVGPYSAVGVLAWLFLYGQWALVAVRLASHER